jgi:hypothetical protein
MRGCPKMIQSPLHVFVVHSPLALVMMALVMKHDGIRQTDVRTILVRNQRGVRKLLGHMGIKSSHADLDLLKSGYYPPQAGLRKIANFDKLMQRMTGTHPFHLYTFDFVSTLNQLAITHAGCQSVSLMEEGTDHMRSLAFQETNHFLLAESQPMYSNAHSDRFFSTGAVGDKVHKLYRFSNFGWPEAQAIDVFDLDVLTAFGPKKQIDTLLLVPKNTDLSSGTRFKELDALKPTPPDRMAVLTVKYHPGITQKEKKIWATHLRERFFQVETITDDTFSVEAALASQKVTRLAGWGSSSLIYARMFGVDCIDLRSP